MRSYHYHKHKKDENKVLFDGLSHIRKDMAITRFGEEVSMYESLHMMQNHQITCHVGTR